MANIVQISLTPHQEKHTFIYDWQETRRGGALDIHPERLTDDDEVARVIRGACPHAPDNISDDNNRNLIHGVEFGVTLGDHIVFTCKNEPFTVFFGTEGRMAATSIVPTRRSRFGATNEKYVKAL